MWSRHISIICSAVTGSDPDAHTDSRLIVLFRKRKKKETNHTGANFSITSNQTLILNLIESVNHPGDASQVAVEV